VDFPLSKLGRGNFIIAGSDTTNGYNVYLLSGIASTFTSGASGTAHFAAGANNMSPLEAYNMDKKVDDGLPNTGTVQARGATTTSIVQANSPLQYLNAANAASGAAASTAGNCIFGSATLSLASNTYNVTNTAANASASTPACSLRFRFN
jgi:hypothetical protein